VIFPIAQHRLLLEERWKTVEQLQVVTAVVDDGPDGMCARTKLAQEVCSKTQSYRMKQVDEHDSQLT